MSATRTHEDHRDLHAFQCVSAGRWMICLQAAASTLQPFHSVSTSNSREAKDQILSSGTLTDRVLYHPSVGLQKAVPAGLLGESSRAELDTREPCRFSVLPVITAERTQVALLSFPSSPVSGHKQLLQL